MRRLSSTAAIDSKDWANCRRPRGQLGWARAAIVAAAALAYADSFSGAFVFDDIPAIVDNASIRHWSTVLRPPIDSTAGGRPFLNLSFAGNYATSGNAVWSYHVVNLAIHMLSGLVLFGLLRRTLERIRLRAALPMAFVAALLWTVHPLQTEAVTYVVQRAESLMGLLYLATLYGFARGVEARENHQLRWFTFSFAACLLGMATKEVMVSAPLIVLLYDEVFWAGSFASAWREHWKIHGALATTWLLLIFLIIGAHLRGASVGAGDGMSFWHYILTQFPAIVRYVKLAVWPGPLVFYYGAESISSLWIVVPTAIATSTAVVVTFWALSRPAPRTRAWGLAGFWFFALLAPTSLIPIVRQTSAEHRMYLALIPVLALLAVALFRLAGRFAFGCGLLWSVILLVITFRRNQDYGTDLRLWSDTVAKCPGNAFAHYNFGRALEQANRLDGASDEYRLALRVAPDLYEAHHNLAQVLIKRGLLPEAIPELDLAARERPESAEAQLNLGAVLSQVDGRLDEAIAHFRRALRLEPANAEAYYNLANALSAIPDKIDEAIQNYRRALSLKPDYPEAHNNLGGALSAAGRPKEAMSEFEWALRQKPSCIEAHNNLGLLLEAAGRMEEATAHFEAAVQLDPGSAQAHVNLANAFAEIPGKATQAANEYRIALQLRPDLTDAHFNLAVTLLRAGAPPAEAVAHLQTVLRLQPGYGPAQQILNQLQAK